jgi:SAM-dependent methyltransferase
MKPELYFIHSQIEFTHWWFMARRDIITKLIHYLIPPKHGELILDIGCGTGGNAVSLAKEYTVFGIDSSLEAVNYAKKIKSDATFIHMDSIDVNNPILTSLLNKAKLILLMDVLEHIKNDVDFFSKIFGCLEQGSFLLITVPAGVKLWSQHDINFGHCRRYESDSFQKLWNDKPVRQLLISYFNYRLYYLIKIFRLINQQMGLNMGEGSTDLKINNPIINRLLRTIFSGESRILFKALSGEGKKGYSKGVSLISILQRT